MAVLEDIEKSILELPAWERALLAEHLIESLDTLTPQENETLWLEEARVRYESYKNGHSTARPAEDVFSDLYKRLQK